jgi:geranylgeranyl pyrophosphate synthase
MTWQAKYADLVKTEVDKFVATLSGADGLRDMVRKPIDEIAFKVEAKGDLARHKPWYLLPMVVCEAISGHYEGAIPACASLQLFTAAGEVFDDIEDADSPNSLSARYGSAVATNAATTLLILAERAIAHLKENGISDVVIVRVLDAVNTFYTDACIGQHRDLSLDGHLDVSEEEYLRIAGMKSASTIECACHIGALLATSNQELIDSLTVFGRNVGMASQIANDIKGITLGNDIINKRVTLPVIFALSHSGSVTHDNLMRAFDDKREAEINIAETKESLFRSGAIHYAMVKMEYYKQCASDVLVNLEKAGVNTGRLASYLE